MMLERSGSCSWTSRETGLVAWSGLMLGMCGVLLVRALNAAALQKVTTGCGFVLGQVRGRVLADSGANSIPAMTACTFRPCRCTEDVSQTKKSSQ